jgi:hypothetical protein
MRVALSAGAAALGLPAEVGQEPLERPPDCAKVDIIPFGETVVVTASS